jgi:hypothetical protein
MPKLTLILAIRRAESERFMSINPYEQILEELRAKRAQIDSDISLVEQLWERWGETGTASTSAVTSNNKTSIPSNAFFTMGIADAAKKLLILVQKRLSTNEIIDGLEQGGLQPRPTYNSVYSILLRRAHDEGDIEKHGSQWGLTEWSSGRRKRKAQQEPATVPEAPAAVPETANPPSAFDPQPPIMEQEITDEDIPF